MIPTLDALLGVTGGLFAGFGLYLLTLSVAASLRRRCKQQGEAPPPRHRLVVLVPAHDEEQLVSRCIGSLLDQSYPRDLYRVIVIADNCTDGTAAMAVAAGAELMVRYEPLSRGKGQALRWAMDRVLAEPSPADAFVIVDADSIADRRMLAALENELGRGRGAVQADYAVLPTPGSPKSELVAAGFLLFHRVRLSGRAALGMPASLVGNGMLFSRELIQKHPWDAFTGVEDLEFTIRLRLAGIRPVFAPAAIVSGPMPATRAGVVRQRLRWEGGRFAVVRARLWPLIRTAIVRRDPSLLDAAVDLATPPLGLLTMASLAGLAATSAAVLAGVVSPWVLAPWIVAIVAIPSFVVIGLIAVKAPASTFRALASAPGFLVWKLLTYGRLVRGFDASRWDRSDRNGELAHEDMSRVEIGGVPIDRVDLQSAVARLRAAIGGPALVQVSTVNLDFVVRAQHEPEIMRIFHQTDLNLADGAPVVWLGKLLGARMPGRVAGADLVPALVSEAARMGARVFLLGGENGVAGEAAARLVAQNPNLVVAGVYAPGVGRDRRRLCFRPHRGPQPPRSPMDAARGS